MKLSAWLERKWYGSRAPAWLTPLEGLYCAGIALRRTLYRTGRLHRGHPGVPVVVVGNLSVGGTGKTPLVAELVERLAEKGRRPGIVSRGYGGSHRGEPRLVGANDRASEVGDEPLLLARRTRVPVCVGADRLAAACRLAGLGVDVIVSDDGLQHYALERDAELVVVDGARGFGNGRCLPAGPLREPLARLDAVDAVVVNGEGDIGRPALRMRLEPEALVEHASGEHLGTETLAGRRVHAVAAIGHPARFFATLAAAGADVLGHALPDHAPVSRRDVEFDDELPVVVTEKDAVKLERDVPGPVWVLSVRARIEGADGAALDGLLESALARTGKGEVS